VISWLNHSVLIIFLLPWAVLVSAEQGSCSLRGMWREMVAPYGSTWRLTWVTFWLAAQYQLFNYAFWSWLPLVSTSSAQSISQSQCIFVYFFSVLILGERLSAVKFLLVAVCFAGVLLLTYGDSEGDGSADGSADGSGNGAPKSKIGPVLGDFLILVPSACNALYAVEWKRLVPGVKARDSLVGLGLLAAWHLVFW
jgi:drug/metabolite transporter (DMT)-like permease